MDTGVIFGPHADSRLVRPPGRFQTFRLQRVTVVVQVDDVPTEMLTYIAVGQENAPLSTAAYLKHIRDGARRHGLPPTYLEYLDGIQHA